VGYTRENAIYNENGKITVLSRTSQFLEKLNRCCTMEPNIVDPELLTDFVIMFWIRIRILWSDMGNLFNSNST
jgi:hypothetical protein